jgi:serine/threonine protein kinase
VTAPATLGRYTLLRRLAAGGMGEVYLAEVQGAAGFSRRVAIKRILPHLAQDEDFVRKFIDEANIMVQLHHGNIVGVLELADHDGELYIVMDYLPGRDLKAVIHRLRQRRTLMPPDLALWLISEVCSALDYAHRKTDPSGQPLGIVHRDVSPSNVVLGAAGEVKLLDFGIARARGRLHQSISGTLQGKFVYMSPEQADGRPVDGRSDVFSAGLLLYELLTGLRPLEGESETETLRKVRQARIAPPSEAAALDPALDALVMKALTPEPDHRYATAADFRRALLHHLADRRSLVDARQLVDLLAELFPEGVVPSITAEVPLSFDDAMALQLGALTPNVNPMTRTRTADPPPRATPSGRLAAGTPANSARRVTDRSQPSPEGPQLVDSAPVLPPPSPAGIKRTLTLGLVLGALVATGVTLWWARRGEATLSPVVEGPAEYQVWVDGAELAPGARVPAGRKVKVCVRARPEYLDACKPGLVLARGENRPEFTLDLSPRLEIQVEPPTPDLRFVDRRGLPVLLSPGEPFYLPFGREFRVCLKTDSLPPGLQSEDTDCQTIPRAEKGLYSLKFRLVPRPVAPPSEAPPTAPPSVPASLPSSEGPATQPPHERPRPRATRLTLTSTPIAQVRCDNGTAGNTPLEVTAEGDAVVCTLTADGFWPATYQVKPGLGSEAASVALLRPALLSVRADPGAAQLFIDGRPAQNPAKKLPVAPGRHTLAARFEKDGQVYRKEVVVTLEAGQLTEVERICLYECPEGVAP